MSAKGTFKKKGGTMFPRIGLQEALGYAKKLVTKTHTAAQKPDTLYPGVFAAKGGRGGIRASALKQYGLMIGTEKDGLEASATAKSLSHAEGDERLRLLQSTALAPRVFKDLYETFKGDATTLARIKQQAQALNVHPDNVDSCATLFIEAAITASLGYMDGDKLMLSAPLRAPTSEGSPEDGDEDSVRDAAPPDDTKEDADKAYSQAPDHTRRGSAVVHVDIKVDSSLDTDKLERQLELLRRYGAL